MGNPQFTDVDGSNAWIMDDTVNEWPVIPGDRPDLNTRKKLKIGSINHSRNGIIFARKVLVTRGRWNFSWTAVTETIVDYISAFCAMEKFRFYPDSTKSEWFDVFFEGDFEPELIGGGNYNISINLVEIGDGLYTSSSSSSSLSSSSSSFSSSSNSSSSSSFSSSSYSSSSSSESSSSSSFSSSSYSSSSSSTSSSSSSSTTS
jgi:hypothetical protein